MAWWFFFPIAFFGGVVLIVLLFSFVTWTIFSSRAYSNRSHLARPDSALQIIRERYAKGEITKEQFEQLTKDLNH